MVYTKSVGKLEVNSQLTVGYICSNNCKFKWQLKEVKTIKRSKLTGKVNQSIFARGCDGL